MSDVTINNQEKRVARPIGTLVNLIKKDLEAAQEAGMEYYRAAGEKLIEAKSQMKHGEFLPWVKRNFEIGVAQAQNYMKLARATEDGEKPSPAFSSISDFRRRHLGHEGVTPGSQRDKDWREPVKETLRKVDLETLNLRKAELARQEERAAQRKLALQLIDIGYKALATRLHPDKGGSRDAMSRLNAVRDRLRNAA